MINKSRILLLFFLSSLVNLHAQKNTLDFKHYPPYLVDGFASVENDTFQIEKDLQNEILNLYDESLNNSSSNRFDYPGSVYVLNDYMAEFIRLNSASSDGFWSDYFTIGYVEKKIDKAFVKLKAKQFTVQSLINLGMRLDKFLKLVNKKPNYILKVKGKKVLKYYWYSKKSVDYLAYKIPSKVATFIFQNGKLIKFGFGKYKAELDKKLYPSAGLNL